jgi:hypothetical protein
MRACAGVATRATHTPADGDDREAAIKTLPAIGLFEPAARKALELAAKDDDVADAARQALEALGQLEAAAKEGAPGEGLASWLEAIFDGKVDEVRAGLKAGLDPDASYRLPWNETRRYPPLLLAIHARKDARKRAVEVVRALLDGGADPNQADEYGMTALHHAAVFDRVEIVEALVKAGANVKATSRLAHPSILHAHAGRTALEMATDVGSKAAARFLKDLAAGRSGQKLSPFDAKVAALRENAFPAIDYEGSEEPVEEALLGSKGGDRFLTLGKTGADCVFALWLDQPGKVSPKAPVAYLDSEGDPRSIIASSLDEFLSLLPYGTGFIYDLVTDSSVKGKASAALAQAAKAEEPVDEVPFMKWWQKTFGVPPAKDPAAVVAKARKANTEFARWLKA